MGNINIQRRTKPFEGIDVAIFAELFDLANIQLAKIQVAPKTWKYAMITSKGYAESYAVLKPSKHVRTPDGKYERIIAWAYGTTCSAPTSEEMQGMSEGESPFRISTDETG